MSDEYVPFEQSDSKKIGEMIADTRNKYRQEGKREALLAEVDWLEKLYAEWDKAETVLALATFEHSLQIHIIYLRKIAEE